MRMALGHTRSRDAHEAGFLELRKIMRSAITHTCAETAYELVHHLGQSPLVGNLGHYTLRYEFLDILLHILEIAVLGTELHGFERAHTAVGLELTAVEDDGLSR